MLPQCAHVTTFYLFRRATAKGGARYKAALADPANAGRPKAELMEQAYTFTNGELVQVAGAEPAYDCSSLYSILPLLRANENCR